MPRLAITNVRASSRPIRGTPLRQQATSLTPIPDVGLVEQSDELDIGPGRHVTVVAGEGLSPPRRESEDPPVTPVPIGVGIGMGCPPIMPVSDVKSTVGTQRLVAGSEPGIVGP